MSVEFKVDKEVMENMKNRAASNNEVIRLAEGMHRIELVIREIGGTITALEVHGSEQGVVYPSIKATFQFQNLDVLDDYIDGTISFLPYDEQVERGHPQKQE
jgi:hypothetical protein